MRTKPQQTRKIAIIVPKLRVGGAERLIVEELSVLRKNKQFEFEVHIIFSTGMLFSHLENWGIKSFVWNAPHKSLRMLITYFRILYYLRTNHFDILHCHLLNSIAPFIGRAAGIKRILTTVHTDTKFSTMERFGLRRNHSIIACGKKVGHNLKNFIPNEKIKILPNAIRTPLIRKTNIIGDYNTVDNSIIVSIGSLVEPKGYDILIRALSEVRREYNAFILFIAGEGKERKRIEELITELNLSANVILLGIIADVHSLLSFADIYINSSRREGLPMTLIEAIAHGLPLIATDVGGNSEIVMENKTGLLVESENPPALSNAILRLLRDTNLRRKLGQGALNLFQKQYKIEQHCNKLIDIYYN